MKNKHGPTRSDLKFRLGFSLIGLAMVGAALVYRGIPQGPGGWEAIGLGTLFFGGTFAWSLWKLIKGDPS
ncbi:hypothetical protein [Tateyamaria sp. SN3-11]|uniref:hypothetical protein n=1 Tax=Tateyamaria sp. SN3-11 TaxID=3092147 RepID=UPI0039ECD240